MKESPTLLPPMRVKIGGRKWSIRTGRIQVTEYMTALGYGRGGGKSYRDDKPSWWPQSIAWERCEHPFDLLVDECKTILETIIVELLKEDPEKYHYGKEEDNEKVQIKRVRKRTKSDTSADQSEKGKRTSKKSKALIEYSDTEDELEEGVVLEEAEENKEEQVSDESLGDDVSDALDFYERQPTAKRKKTTAKSQLRKKAEMPETTVSEYEKIQAKNIAEKNQMRENLFEH